MEHEIDAIIRGEATLEDAIAFVEQRLAPVVEIALSTEAAPELDDKIYAFTQAILRVCVYFMCRPEPLHSSIR